MNAVLSFTITSVGNWLYCDWASGLKFGWIMYTFPNVWTTLQVVFFRKWSWNEGWNSCVASKLCLTLATPWTIACQAPQSMEFSRQEYWSGLPFPNQGDLPDPGIKLKFLCLLHCRQILYLLTHRPYLEHGGLLSIGSQSQTWLKWLSMHACIGHI